MYKLADTSLGEVTFPTWDALVAFLNSPAIVYGVEFSETSWEDLGESPADHFKYGIDSDGRVEIRQAAVAPSWKQDMAPSHFVDLGLGMDEVINIFSIRS